MNERMRLLASKHQKLIGSQELQQCKSMKALICKLKARKHRLIQLIPNLKEGYERNYQRNCFEKVGMQLKDVQRAYAKTGKNWHPIVKQAETLKTHVLLLERDAKKKALIMDKLKKKLAKIRMPHRCRSGEKAC